MHLVMVGRRKIQKMTIYYYLELLKKENCLNPRLRRNLECVKKNERQKQNDFGNKIRIKRCLFVSEVVSFFRKLIIRLLNSN
mmetsp:Transcript_7968/g.12029  ORF Transcript_7968/g.12029 Transcript_7968/m.12029 type:complete len:82 (+) Transcript_7968:248-493(+)